MTDRDRIENVVKSAYAARNAKDLDAVARIFRPDAVFHLAGAPATFPGALRVTGEASLRAAIGALIEEFDFLEQTMLASVIEGNKAAVHWRVRMKHNPSGEIVDTELFDLWTIDGDRVASVVQFCDTALAASLMTRT